MSSGDGRTRASDLALDLSSLAKAYATGACKPTEVLEALRARIAARGDDGVWISVVSAAELERAGLAVEARRRAGESLPLFGIPFAVKDNIDVAGLPTTAACPAFARTPVVSAHAVQRLVAAGAIVVGKTNMDQFASGLVGVRSPYGVPRNPFHADFVCGGSSSGSAVAVATGQVSFALGTDTAGSGRVPAAYNNIVGIKPSPGLVSTAGVVPACRSLDCVSVFAASCEEGGLVAEVMRGFDPNDPFSRPDAQSVSFVPVASAGVFRFGVIKTEERDFLGDDVAATAFEAAVAVGIALGGTPVEIPMAPFREAGSLLYAGPFVAERLEAAGQLFAERPDVLLPPLRSILADAGSHTAAEAFGALARLRMLRRQVAALWNDVDFALFPTAPTLPRLDAVERDPMGINGRLGTYTNFVNLLDLAAVAVPCGFRDDGLPVGVTLVGPWGSDGRLAGWATRFHRATSARIGATSWPLPPEAAPHAVLAPSRPSMAEPHHDTGRVLVAVVGAHLSGEPLNHQLRDLGATLVRAARTAPCYRLFALPGTTPPKPGLLRKSGPDGAAIDVEVWSLTPAAFGVFAASIPAPLGIGRLELEDGASVSGFLCEAYATEKARDISPFGGWRAFLRSQS